MTSLIHITPILHINYFSVFPIIFPLYNHCFLLKYGKLISFLWHINHHSHFHRISIVGYTIPLLLVMKSPVNPIFFPTICLFLVVKYHGSAAPRAADGSIAIETVNYSAVPHPDVPPMKWQDWAQQRAVQDLELKVYCTIYIVMYIYMCLHIVILYYM